MTTREPCSRCGSTAWKWKWPEPQYCSECRMCVICGGYMCEHKWQWKKSQEGELRIQKSGEPM